MEKDWLSEEWSKGGYTSVCGPGVLSSLGSSLRAPVGRIHFAGTETARVWQGYMEGALESAGIMYYFLLLISIYRKGNSRSFITFTRKNVTCHQQSISIYKIFFCKHNFNNFNFGCYSKHLLYFYKLIICNLLCLINKKNVTKKMFLMEL